MADRPSPAAPSDPRQALESITRNVRLRLADEARAGLSAVPRPASPVPEVMHPTPPQAQAPEVLAADTLRQELEQFWGGPIEV